MTREEKAKKLTRICRLSASCAVQLAKLGYVCPFTFNNCSCVTKQDWLNVSELDLYLPKLKGLNNAT